MLRLLLACLTGALVAALPSPAAARAQPAAAAPDSAAALAARADGLYAHQRAPDTEAAIALWRRAAALAERAGDRAGVGRVLYRAGRAQFALGRADSALVTLHAALAASRAAGDRRTEGAALHRIGTMHFGLGRVDSTRAYFAAAAPLLHASDDRAEEAALLRHTGVLFASQGHADSAIAFAHRALAAFRGAGDRAGESSTLSDLGIHHHNAGRLDTALVYYQRALAIQRATNDRLAVGYTLNSLGTLHQAFGRADSAAAYFGQALAAHEATGNRPHIARALVNLGSVHEDQRPDSAIVYYQRALAIRRAVSDRRGEAVALNMIARASLRARRVDSALVYARQALAGRRVVGDGEGESASLLVIGSAHRLAGHADSARAVLGQALAAARRRGDPSDESDVLDEFGRLYGASGATAPDLARSVAYFDSAAAALARMRGRVGADAHTIGWSERTRETYTRWALAWLARSDDGSAGGRARAALAAVERGRARALLAVMGAARLTGPDTTAGADLAAEADRLVAPLRARRAAALSYLVAGDTLVTWLVTPGGEVRVAQAALPRDTLDALVRRVRGGVELAGAGSTPALARARAALAAEEVSEGAADERAASAAWAVSPAAFDAALRQLAGVLLPAEFARLVPAGSDLVIVPNGSLGLLPFGALLLPDAAGAGTAPLAARYAVRYAPSLATLAALGDAAPRTRPATAGALVVGNPVMPAARGVARTRGALEPLPGAEREARQLARQLGARALTGAAASESAVRAALPAAGVVHLATHGIAFTSDARVLDSFVALAADSASDGLLTVGEVLDDPALRLTADLVVLSACQTGLGNLKQAEGVVGLQRAFLARGARSVLVSLWNVSDAATELLMRRLYAHWLGDRDRPGKAEALRRAQADVRATPGFAHPRYWAAFQLVGAS